MAFIQELTDNEILYSKKSIGKKINQNSSWLSRIRIEINNLKLIRNLLDKA